MNPVLHLHFLKNRDKHLPNLQEEDHKGGAGWKRRRPKKGDEKRGLHAFLLKISYRKPSQNLFLLTFSFFPHFTNDIKATTVSVCNTILHFSNNIKYCLLYCIIPHKFILLRKLVCILL